MVEDRVQDLDSVTCGISRVYFLTKYDNKKTIETLLNEHFILDNQDENEEIIRQYANDNGVTVTQNIKQITFCENS